MLQLFKRNPTAQCSLETHRWGENTQGGKMTQLGLKQRHRTVPEWKIQLLGHSSYTGTPWQGHQPGPGRVWTPKPAPGSPSSPEAVSDPPNLLLEHPAA